MTMPMMLVPFMRGRKNPCIDVSGYTSVQYPSKRREGQQITPVTHGIKSK